MPSQGGPPGMPPPGGAPPQGQAPRPMAPPSPAPGGPPQGASPSPGGSGPPGAVPPPGVGGGQDTPNIQYPQGIFRPKPETQAERQRISDLPPASQVPESGPPPAAQAPDPSDMSPAKLGMMEIIQQLIAASGLRAGGKVGQGEDRRVGAGAAREGVDQNSIPTLDPTAAAAFCGPAALLFMMQMHRPPTAEEAQALRQHAEKAGWTPGAGMGGPGAFSKLASSYGVKLTSVPGDPSEIAKHLQAGQPVVVSTPGHYWQLGDYDQSTQKFLAVDTVGRSRWLTLDDIQKDKYGGPIQSVWAAPASGSETGGSPTNPQTGRALQSVPENVRGQIIQVAQQNGLDPALFAALIQQESSFDPNAKSRAGARGLTQLMPETAKALGVKNIDDLMENLNGGAKYLKQLLDERHGNVEEALSMYNSGKPDAYTDKVQGYSETKAYVPAVMKNYERMKGETGGSLAGGGTMGAPSQDQTYKLDVPALSKPQGLPAPNITNMFKPGENISMQAPQVRAVQGNSEFGGGAFNYGSGQAAPDRSRSQDVGVGADDTPNQTVIQLVHVAAMVAQAPTGQVSPVIQSGRLVGFRVPPNRNAPTGFVSIQQIVGPAVQAGVLDPDTAQMVQQIGSLPLDPNNPVTPVNPSPSAVEPPGSQGGFSAPTPGQLTNADFPQPNFPGGVTGTQSGTVGGVYGNYPQYYGGSSSPIPRTSPDQQAQGPVPAAAPASMFDTSNMQQQGIRYVPATTEDGSPIFGGHNGQLYNIIGPNGNSLGQQEIDPQSHQVISGPSPQEISAQAWDQAMQTLAVQRMAAQQGYDIENNQFPTDLEHRAATGRQDIDLSEEAARRAAAVQNTIAPTSYRTVQIGDRLYGGNDQQGYLPISITGQPNQQTYQPGAIISQNPYNNNINVSQAPFPAGTGTRNGAGFIFGQSSPNDQGGYTPPTMTQVGPSPLQVGPTGQVYRTAFNPDTGEQTIIPVEGSTVQQPPMMGTIGQTPQFSYDSATGETKQIVPGYSVSGGRALIPSYDNGQLSFTSQDVGLSPAEQFNQNLQQQELDLRKREVDLSQQAQERPYSEMTKDQQAQIGLQYAKLQQDKQDNEAARAQQNAQFQQTYQLNKEQVEMPQTMALPRGGVGRINPVTGEFGIVQPPEPEEIRLVGSQIVVPGGRTATIAGIPVSGGPNPYGNINYGLNVGRPIAYSGAGNPFAGGFSYGGSFGGGYNGLQSGGWGQQQQGGYQMNPFMSRGYGF